MGRARRRGAHSPLIPLLVADFKNRWATWTHAPPAEKWRGLAFIFLIVAFFIAAEFLSHRLFRSFLSVGDVTFQFLAILLTLRLLGLLFLIVMGLLFFGGMIAAIEALYFDDDIDFLASHPISRPAILLKKLIAIYLNSAWVVFLIVTPVITAYGRAIAGSFTHLPLSLAAIFLFTIPSVAFSATVVIFLMRFMPVDRAKEAVLGIGVLLSFGVIYLYRLLSPAKIFGTENIARFVADTQSFIREFTLPGFEALPSNIMAQALVAVVPGRYEEFFKDAGILAAIAAISIAIYISAGSRLFETDRPVSGSSARPGPLERVFHLTRVSRFFADLAPQGTRMMIHKEIMTNVRDPMQISHLVLMIAIVVLHFVNLSEIPFHVHSAARVLVAFLNLGLVGFLIAGVAVRFVYPSISLEGHPFWAIETSPLSSRNYLLVKFFACWIPLGAAAIIVVVASNAIIGVSAGLMTLWIFATVAIVTVVTAFGIATGVTMPVFDRKNVFEISSSPGGIIFMLMSLLYVGAVITVLVAPTYASIFDARGMLGRSAWSIFWILVSAVGLTLASWRIALGSVENFTERKYAVG